MHPVMVDSVRVSEAYLPFPALPDDVRMLKSVSGKRQGSSFAPTSHALRLMEFLAASVKACEPVLLVSASGKHG